MKKLNILLYSVVGVLASTPIFAAGGTQDLSERIDNVSKSVKSGGSMFLWIVGVAGIALLFMGIMGLKKYADDQRQNPLMKPMIYIIAGALMSGFTAFRNILTSTTTGSNSKSTVEEPKFSPTSGS